MKGVVEFKYLRWMIRADVGRRYSYVISEGEIWGTLAKLWKGNTISGEIKMALYKRVVIPTVMRSEMSPLSAHERRNAYASEVLYLKHIWDVRKSESEKLGY